MITSGRPLMMERPFPFEANGAAVERLPAPANLTADVTGDTVTLEWDAVIDADHYEARAGGAWVVLGDVLTTDIEDLEPGNYTGQVRAVAGDGVKGHSASVAFEIELILTPLASIDISDVASIDSFTRAGVAGYTGASDADDYQREAATDELRDAHEVGSVLCVLLEDDPTQAALIAPTLGTPTVDGLDVTIEVTPPYGDWSYLRYRFDGAGDWVDLAPAETTIEATGSAGEHTIDVQAVTAGDVTGLTANSTEFELEAGGGGTLQYSHGVGTLGSYTGNAEFSYYRLYATQFTIGSGFTVSAIEVRVDRFGTVPAGTLTAEIRTNSGGSPGTLVGSASSTIDRTTVSTSEHWLSFDATATLAAGTYWVAFGANATESGGSIRWYWEDGSAGKKGSTDGSTWDTTGAADLGVKIYGS